MNIRCYIGFLCLAFGLTACHSVRNVLIHKEVPAIGEGKLLKNIQSEELDYHTLFAKKMEISLSQGKKTENFRASMKIRRDSFIQVSVTAPLGIEVARVLLTRDSVKFADIYHKRYFIGDYQYFYDKTDIRLGYECVEKILTNVFFNFQSCGGVDNKEKRYKLDRTNVGYELSSIEQKALSRKIKKLYKKKRKNKEYILILQKILIDPWTFRPLSMSLEDMDENMGVSVDYQDFKVFNEKNFPEKIRFALFSDHKKTSLEVRFIKLEFDVKVEPNFRISSKYKKIERFHDF